MNIDDIEKIDDYQNNEKEMKKIENDVMMLSQTMTDLHDLIQDQSDSIQTLEDFIHSSNTETKQGYESLNESNEYQDSTNWYNMYTFGGLVVSIGFIIFVL